MNMLRWAIAAAGVAALGAAAGAQSDRRPAAAGPSQAEPAATMALGRKLAAEGNPLGAAPCAQCHAIDGAGGGDGAFPRLAGQSAAYLHKQLADYASETRPNAIMTPIAQALSEPERQAASVYYAATAGGAPAGTAVDAAALRRGGRLFALGEAERGIQACGNCHGPDGRGLPPLLPKLAGQHATYTEQQLQLFQQGVRRNDVAAVMRELSGKLGPADIAALAAYLQTVRPTVASRGDDGRR